MTKKSKLVFFLAEFPYYRPMPWEHDRLKEYAANSVKHFSTSIDGRTKEQKEHDAYVGALGEFAFVEMLKNQSREMINEWPLTDNNFSEEYDIKGKDGMTIDIKTTVESDKVTIPGECNFVVGFSQFNIKMSHNIKLCDSYVQMFVTKDYSDVYFIGAISQQQIMKYMNNDEPWPVRGRTWGLIRRENMDLTDKFRSYFTEDVNMTYRRE